ncbi:hypothetical protein [Melittangium boletus]|uniref:hypothetical protein n=1 Tax=Melittangium boletus TaxID=83453 RepID=UPI003DA6C3EB
MKPAVPVLVGLVWALGLAASPVRAEAGADASPPALRVVSVPAYGVLGEERAMELRVEAPPGSSDVEVFVSEGQVSPVAPVAPGLFRATYVPPRQRLPREVILLARARGPRGPWVGWSVLPLWGQGLAEVSTRAGAPVTLQVGERSFGPVEADAQGLAHVPLLVPPGQREALFGTRRIDLGVPPWPCVHAVAERHQVRADREETVDVRLFLSRLPGTPAPRGDFTFTASRGAVGPPREVEPGVWLVRWTLPPGPAGEVVLRGGQGKEPRWAWEVGLEAVAGPARRFELTVDREEFVATESARLTVEARARDAADNPVAAALRLEADGARVDALGEQRPGVYTGGLRPPARFDGRTEVTLRLFAEGTPEPVATRRLRLRAGPLARVRMAPVRPVLVADGHTEVAWHISVEDRYGNPVEEAAPRVSLVGGVARTLQARAPGQYELRYVPPESRVDGRSEVEIQVGAMRERGSVPLLRRSRVTLAPHVGGLTNFADVRAPSGGVRLELWPVRAWSALGVMVDLGVLGFSRTDVPEVPDFAGRVLLVDTALLVGLRSPREHRLQGWGAVGPSLARMQGRSAWGEGRVLAQGAWVPGAQAVVGAGVALGPGLPFLEARLSWFNDPALPVLRGSLGGAGLHLGYRLDLY